MGPLGSQGPYCNPVDLTQVSVKNDNAPQPSLGSGKRLMRFSGAENASVVVMVWLVVVKEVVVEVRLVEVSPRYELVVVVVVSVVEVSVTVEVEEDEVEEVDAVVVVFEPVVVDVTVLDVLVNDVEVVNVAVILGVVVTL
mmetsp:Transcript_102881/g.182765  ORF Transcript_102881/g.182765 Transcript_102881/m.182765 type:complete len:140 (+) Transcript_102881:166-585(+)